MLRILCSPLWILGKFVPVSPRNKKPEAVLISIAACCIHVCVYMFSFEELTNTPNLVHKHQQWQHSAPTSGGRPVLGAAPSCLQSQSWCPRGSSVTEVPEGSGSRVRAPTSPVPSVLSVCHPRELGSGGLFRSSVRGNDPLRPRWGSSDQVSHSVVSDSLRPHGLQHARLPIHHQLPELTQTHVLKLHL